MTWIQLLAESVKTLLMQTGTGPVALLLSFALGLLSATVSTCCTLPLLGAVAGYSGARKDTMRSSALITALFFMLGTVISLMIIGGVAGFIGQTTQSIVGKYWKIVAGIFAICAGVAALDLLPFNLPKLNTGWINPDKRNLLGTALFGLVIGGAIGVCSLPCNPGIFIILGVAIIQGYNFWALAILVMYAFGFSIPLTAIVLGVSFGKTFIKAQAAEKIIRITGGVILIAVGFYFLYSL